MRSLVEKLFDLVIGVVEDNVKMNKVIQGCWDGAKNNFLSYSSSNYQQGNNNTYVEKHEQRGKSRKRERVKLNNVDIMIPNFMDRESNGSTSV